MARKKGSVTLFELLQKDHADRQNRYGMADSAPAAPQSRQPGSPLEPVPTVPAQPQAPSDPADPDDGETYTFHVTRTHAYVAAGVAAVAVVLIILIGSRMGGEEPAAPVADQGQQADPSTGDQVRPLPSLIPPLEITRQDSPTLESPTPAAAAVATESTRGQAAPATGLTTGDTRRAGLNYLVIQNVAAANAAHVAEIRKFLAGKEIRTLAVPGPSAGSTWVISEQGFNWDDPADKARLEELTRKVEQAGKEYAARRLPGGYTFQGAYPAKYKGN